MLIAWLAWLSNGANIPEQIENIYQTQHFTWFGWSIHYNAIEKYNPHIA
jgi:hypothetical protein